jgi:preprotein translocase subunit SecG
VVIVYNILLVLGFFVAIVFTTLVLFTGKGDAMSGGTSVRTSFKGKASFDDLMSNILLGLGISFMAIAFLINIISVHIKWS